MAFPLSVTNTIDYVRFCKNGLRKRGKLVLFVDAGARIVSAGESGSC